MRFWLLQMYRLATPFVRLGVSPSAISVLGTLLIGLGVALAHTPVPAALVIVAGGLMDGLDGAVAVLRNRVSARGAMVDAICDRIGDALLMVALWRAGAPAVVCLLAAAVFALHEYVRSLLRVQERSDPARTDETVTVAERPTRVIVVVAFLLADGTARGWSDDLVDVDRVWLFVGAWTALVLGLAGLAQLTRWVTRTLP